MEKNLIQQPIDGLIKVVCFGPESTGKTTLAKALAMHYKTTWVQEYMRTYFEKKWKGKKGTSMIEDLMPIALGQMASENQKAQVSDRLLFCDTNLLQLKVYSQAYFNEFCPPEIEKPALKNHYDLYFLMAIDIPWEEDNLRDKPQEREAMFNRFKNELVQHNKPFIVLEGDFNQRFEKAQREIESLIKRP